MVGYWNNEMINEKVLLERISNGDQDAFRVIFTIYRHKVFSYAFKIIKCRASAEDIVHDVFLKIWTHPDLNGINNLESYLKITSRNITLKVLRRQALETQTANNLGTHWDETHNETEEIIIVNDFSKILNQAINLLPQQQKLVYNLCREEGLKYSEAAERLSISPLTVKTHMQLALRFLKSYLSKHGDVVLCLIFSQVV
ncbi:MAG: RNA polymerase sigma factor [Sphingobacteriaceae bacterium]